MTETETVNAWLQHLQPELALNEANYCALQSAEVALVAEVPGTGQCHVFGVVMPAPDEFVMLPWLQEAMQLNLMGRPLMGSWLAYDPEQSVLFLCQNFTIDRTSADEFAAGIATMMETLRAVRERLSPSDEVIDELRGNEDLAAE